MEVSIFIPCFVDQLFPQTAVNMCTVLRTLGCKIDYPPNQTCCGQAAYNAGFVSESRVVCEKFVTDFATAKIIVCPSASCVAFLRNYLSEVLPQEKITASIYEFSEFVVTHCDLSLLKPTYHVKAVCHDSCAALRECKIKEEPRQLLALVNGLELLENPDYETDCCGFGGTFAIKYEPISVAMGAKKVEAALALGAACIISTDWSCLMHLQGYIDQQKLDIKTLHIADVLVE